MLFTENAVIKIAEISLGSWFQMTEVRLHYICHLHAFQYVLLSLGVDWEVADFLNNSAFLLGSLLWTGLKYFNSTIPKACITID